jgi:hypothetical protein
MPEGLSASEVGKEISEHAKHADPHERRDRLISITEAVLLSAVALLAAWSGYAASKWTTQSRVEIATASSLRIEGSRADADAFELRSYDSSTFDAWFSAFIAGDKTAMRLAARRFRPDFKVAFERDGSTADKYVRLTVVLASILFLVGISTHFPYRGVRYGLIGLGLALLVLSLVQLSQLPLPPS